MLSRTLSSRKCRTLKKAVRPTSFESLRFKSVWTSLLYWERTGKKQNDVCEILRANFEWKLLVKHGKIFVQVNTTVNAFSNPASQRQPVSLHKVKLCLLTQFRICPQIQLFSTSFSWHSRVRELQFVSSPIHALSPRFSSVQSRRQLSLNQVFSKCY